MDYYSLGNRNLIINNDRQSNYFCCRQVNIYLKSHLFKFYRIDQII
jgi:hypothetical protein